MRVYNGVDGSLLGTYHGGHCHENSDSDQHLIVVSTSGRISASWSSDGSVTRTGFSCLFTSGTSSKHYLIAINKDSLSIVVTKHIVNISLFSTTPVEQADAPVGNDNSMFEGYSDQGNYNLFTVWNFYKNC